MSALAALDRAYEAWRKTSDQLSIDLWPDTGLEERDVSRAGSAGTGCGVLLLEPAVDPHDVLPDPGGLDGCGVLAAGDSGPALEAPVHSRAESLAASTPVLTPGADPCHVKAAVGADGDVRPPHVTARSVAAGSVPASAPSTTHNAGWSASPQDFARPTQQEGA